jgi:hypothetical protein
MAGLAAIGWVGEDDLVEGTRSVEGKELDEGRFIGKLQEEQVLS